MDVRGTEAVADIKGSSVQVTRRRLMLRDGLTFLSLTAVAIVLAGVTALLFRTFEAHREALSDRWAERGRTALQQGRSADAVEAMRTALTYRPDDRGEQLALAQALAASGRTVEAESYFLNLWQTQPGDGPINLQLARLERSRGNAEAAVDYYRAAIFGTWSGDGPARRRDIRLELSGYLMERGQARMAVELLLIAAGNNRDAATQLAIAQALEAARDFKDALVAYRNAAEHDDDRAIANAKAGALCYRIGDYVCAAELLGKALHAKTWPDDQKLSMSAQHEAAERSQELSFSQDLSAEERTAHLLHDTRLAQDRLKDCAVNEAVAMQPLQEQWKALDSARNRIALRHDDALREQYGALVFESELVAASACGAPTGDDALLLHLKDHPMTHLGAQPE